ncbi:MULTISPECIES: bifunctional glycosyltransferase family 2/GtrA family protein [Aerococcus]|uniref:Glycosyltransferase n=1 Tax=Aerococcus tenax TaxID=3078812 RepID=A0A5N1BTG5_9LACT|nr:bifunctional glycosyltransferase family 2/GtrA family protein [Aerococcus urinae]KAA9241499.1 glycosyltransferase [Aerococcus urinae]MDK6370726.1 bifunctional glycosyltransferase family 2/GtrA family protein [Aerococcus urinae]MDK6598055.1 bifunctional glycosyltransferase family 2/GtrA family protein [Aerococcus urinae]MDK7302067.1 bifunctional glycosyltransferase family 2/GtrA family protein [Aerococcus urinae]MDK7800983.1 bifunctional glycosyltransferase family 2/GtrA family protein [Aero
MSISDITIIIPALEPNEKLIVLLESIRRQDSDNFTIIIVNDGSSADYDSYFKQAHEDFGAIVLKHEENYGKGRALRTAFDYILHHLPDCQGVITIDSDGQHTYADMMKCIGAFQQDPSALVLGVRDFQNEVPWKSQFGNRLTRYILKMVTGISLTDTQTGLRVIPKTYLARLLEISGDRFEYELKMIIDAAKQEIPIKEVAIETIYHDDNKGSHFNPIKDSIAIYSVFLEYMANQTYFWKYILSSVSSFVVDILLFHLFSVLLPHAASTLTIYLATIIARTISSVFNYTLNRFLVFKQESKQSFIKYVSLVIVQMFLSGGLVSLISTIMQSQATTFIKIFVDSMLFLLSYFIQKHFIFKSK